MIVQFQLPDMLCRKMKLNRDFLLSTPRKGRQLFRPFGECAMRSGSVHSSNILIQSRNLRTERYRHSSHKPEAGRGSETNPNPDGLAAGSGWRREDNGSGTDF